MSQVGHSKYSANTRRKSGIALSTKSEQDYVKVVVRCRPMSEKEISDGHKSIIDFEGPKRIVVHDTSQAPSEQLGTNSGERKNFSHVYDFDAVFDCKSTQKDVYGKVCKPIVDSVLEGYNGTVFAYGQTGTGKTYTMEGADHRKAKLSSKNKRSANSKLRASKDSSTKLVAEDNLKPNVANYRESIGIIPRTFEHIFEYIRKQSDVQFLVRASYLEVYQEEIHDLLKKDRSVKLELHERPDIGVYVKDLTSFICKSIEEIERVMRVGNQNRAVAATDMNEHSSRSHAIFMITVEQQSLIVRGQESSLKEGKKGNPLKEGRVIKVGKLNLVDLAGSERQRKTNSFGERQKESIKINLSLSALGNVINSLMMKHKQQQSSKTNDTIVKQSTTSFTPYRDSKLTRLLQDSLGGNAKTLMIANVGPASYNYDETINTLNYASRAKCIRNNPRLNEDPKDALLRELQREIDELRSKLITVGGGGRSSNSENLSAKTNIQNGKRVELELTTLRKKLSSLESKLLNGGGQLDPNILQSYTQEQAAELEKSRAELANQMGKEKAIKDELERGEEAELSAKKSFNSVQQELDAKKRLIRQILIKVRTMRDQIEETQRAYRLELDELDQLQYVLQKELKLKCLIMDNFVPNNHVDQLLPRIVYDERRNLCQVQPIELPLDYCNISDKTLQFDDFWRPTYDSIRPKSEFERIGETIYPSNIRYKYEELIEPKLHAPKLDQERKLGVEVDNCNLKSSRLQTMIDDTLNQREPDIVI